MKKSDLINGSVVELRNSTGYILIDNILYNNNMSGDYTTLNSFNDSLYHNIHDGYDIMKVMLPLDKCNGNAISLVTNDTNWTWERKESIHYYYVDSLGDINMVFEDYNNITELRMFTKLFATKEEAEFERERIEVEIALFNLSDVSNDKAVDSSYCKFYMFYSLHKKRLSMDVSMIFVEHQYYFSTLEKCQEAIDIIGEERLIKYYFGVR